MSECCSWLAEYFPEECLKRTTVAEENKRKLRLVNSQDACLLRVDGCWIDTEKCKKCDYIMFCYSSKRAFLAEMKGADIKTAGQQLISTYDQLPKSIKQAFSISACIVSSRTPKVDSGVMRMKARFKKMKLVLTIKNRQLDIN